MKPIIIDIETRPDERLKDIYDNNNWKTTNQKGERQYPDYKEMALDTDYADIICICMKQLGSDKIKTITTPEGLEGQGGVLKQYPLLGWNCKKFDLPIIIKYGIREGLDLPYKRLKNACKPYGYSDRCKDLMAELSFRNGWKSLDEMAQIYLGKEKDSKSNEEFFANASIEEIIDHCKDDVRLTEELYKKFNSLF